MYHSSLCSSEQLGTASQTEPGKKDIVLLRCAKKTILRLVMVASDRHEDYIFFSYYYNVILVIIVTLLEFKYDKDKYIAGTDMTINSPSS